MRKDDFHIDDYIFEMIKEVNLENSIKSQPQYNLDGMLGDRNITWLRKLARLHGIKRSHKKDKAQIIPELKDMILDPVFLSEFLYTTDLTEWDFFKKVASVKYLQDDTVFFDIFWIMQNLGIMWLYYYDNRFYYVVPNEIKKLFKKLLKTEFINIKRYHDVLNIYAKAAVSLYGFIRKDEFVELYNSYSEVKTTIEDVNFILTKFAQAKDDFCFWEDYIVCSDFEENNFEDMQYYLDTTASKPRYIPPVEEFIKYSDWEYFEKTPSVQRLIDFINENLCSDPNITEYIVEKIHFLCAQEASPDEYMDVFEDFEIFLNKKMQKKIFDILVDVNNNTRMWQNKGHTPEELYRDEVVYPNFIAIRPYKGEKDNKK